MSSDQQPVLPNRQIPFSKAFTEFISTDWAPYGEQLPPPLPATAHTAARREKVSAMFPGERIVIPAGGLRVRSNDTDFRYRPHSAFAHLTGLGTDREPDAVLVMEPLAGGHEACLYFSPRAPRTDPEFYSSSRYGEMWVGQRESLEEMSAMAALPTAPIRDLKDAVGRDTETVRVRVLRDADPDVTAMVDTARGGAQVDCDTELQVALSELRLVKDPYELDQLRAACRATATGFEAVVAELPRAVAAGRGERWVEGVFGLHARHAGNAVGYDTIAACGDHATTLHWIRNDGDLRDGDLLLIDAGVELDSLYTADVTRTLPVSGTFTPAQRMVYEAVLEAQQAGIDAARPGVKMRSIHDAAIAVIARRLSEWGILPVSAEESLSDEGGQHRRWMVHGTSHHLGLDVHDCAQARQENYREGILAEGMVVTVEPGIYFKSTDLLVPEELRGIGIRIEDDIAITADGCEILSAALPRDPDEVEAWIGGIWGRS
ncbi:MAG TPA: aminopeptidase P family protein [Propionibacteriaceae bacterium]|nr:aminopeptidase P family protein [Propionibacteriaceae bacterium]